MSDPKVVQQVGMPSTTAVAYVGPDRQLIVDTDNYDLLIQDGATPGGKRLLNQDNADARYSQINAEVEGIGPFEPEDKGLLTRLGPADYVLRKLTYSSDFTITNPDGFAGNPLIALSGTVAGDLHLEGQLEVDGVAQFNAGINADVAGNLTGNVTGNVTGNLTGNVTGSVTGNVTGNLTGNVTGNADTATHAGTATTATTATTAGSAGSATLAAEATVADAWKNARTITVTGVVTGAVTLDGSADVGLALSAGVLGEFVPPGAIFWFALATPPMGYLECNGQAILRASFPNLNALANGTGYAAPWGAGDGSTTFNVPDLRAQFIRGFDHGRGVDSGRAFGSAQTDSAIDHTHNMAPNYVGASGGSLTLGGAGSPISTTNGITGLVTSPNGGGTETRPKNVALLPVIKT